jgi:alpha-amylase
VGYDVYDLFDLGEFDQKGGQATKYGTKEELITAIQTGLQHGIVTYVDTVLNHRWLSAKFVVTCKSAHYNGSFGADRTERFLAVEVQSDDRTKEISGWYTIEVRFRKSSLVVNPSTHGYYVGVDQVRLPRTCKRSTHFGLLFNDGLYSFLRPWNGNQDSDLKWNYNHFTGVDYNNDGGKKAIFRIYGENKYWAQAVDRENKNYDYLSAFFNFFFFFFSIRLILARFLLQ